MSAAQDTTTGDEAAAPPADPRDRRFRIGLAVLTVLAGASFVSGIGPLQAATMLPFVLLCPGIAWSRQLSDDLADVVGFGVAISMALTAVVAQGMALAAWWSPGTGFVALAALTALGVALPKRRGGAATADAASEE